MVQVVHAPSIIANPVIFSILYANKHLKRVFKRNFYRILHWNLFLSIWLLESSPRAGTTQTASTDMWTRKEGVSQMDSLEIRWCPFGLHHIIILNIYLTADFPPELAIWYVLFRLFYDISCFGNTDFPTYGGYVCIILKLSQVLRIQTWILIHYFFIELYHGDTTFRTFMCD